jgi:Ca2+-binding EF-hand superfamily protein
MDSRASSNVLLMSLVLICLCSFLCPEENLAAVFNQFDANHDGQLGASEIAQMMAHIGRGSSMARNQLEADRILDEMDEDGDGGVSIDEFATHVTMGQLGKDKAQIKATFDVRHRERDGLR